MGGGEGREGGGETQDKRISRRGEGVECAYLS